MEWKVGDLFTHCNINNIIIRIVRIDRIYSGQVQGLHVVYKVTGNSLYKVGDQVPTSRASCWTKIIPKLVKSNKPIWF